MASLKRIILISSLIVLVPFFAGIARAQDDGAEFTDPSFDYNVAYQDYVNTSDVYKQAHSDYALARAQYLQAQTLVSRSKAIEATIEMLEARDNVVIAYLVALAKKVDEEESISDVVKSGLINRINAEIFWFDDHKSRVGSAGTLEDLEEESAEASERFSLTAGLSYESLTEIANSRTTDLRNELNLIVSDARQKTFEIRSNGDLDISNTERWLLESENKITRSLDKSIAVEQRIQSFTTVKMKDLSEHYDESLLLLQESQQFLREGSSNMREVLKSITQR